MSIADHFAHAKEVSIAEVEAAVACMHGIEPEPVIVAQEVTVDDIKDEVVAVAASTAVTAEENADEADMTDAFEELAASLAEMPAQSESMVTQDTVLLDIFTNEANSYLDEIATYLADLPAQYKAVAVTDQMLRALHTLRGSAGMAGIKAIALIAAPMEQLLKDLRNQHRGLQHKHIELLAESHRLIKQSIVDVMAGGEGFIPEVNDFVARVESTAHAPVSLDDENVVAEAASPVNAAGLVAGFLDLGLDHLLDAPWELSGWLSAPDHAEHIQLLVQELERLAPSAKNSMVLPLAEISNQLIYVYRFIAEDAEKALANEQLLEDLANAHDEIINIFDTLAASQTVTPNPKLVERLREWGGSPVVNLPTESSYVPPVAEVDEGADPELLSIFLEEAEEVLTAADDELNNWRANLEDKQPLRVLQRHLHTLKGGARMAVVASLGDLGHELEFLYEDLVNNRYQATQVLIDLLQRCHDRLAEMIEDLQKEGRCKFAKDLVDVIDLYRHKPSDAVILDFFSPAAGGLTKVENIETVSSVAIPESLAIKTEVEIAPTPVISTTSAAVEYDSASQDLDPDLLAIFLEEAQEIVDETNAGLQEWIKQPENVTPVQILQRGLHTLKGGAFMSGVKSLGDLAHEMENIYEGVCLKRYHGTPDVFSLLQRCHDRIADAVVSLQDNGKSLSVGDLVEQLKRYLSSPATFKDEIAVVAATPVAPVSAPSVSQAVTTIEKVESSLPVIAEGMMPAMTGNFRQATNTQAAQEMIRVSSELMEKLINLAGETSITRSRVEMGVHGFAQTVEEMGATVQRLVDQLRRMEGELEVQILASHTEEASKYEDFDPLEMDQYSSLNQLSKSLSESASDLFEIKATLIEKARDTETLLLQQARLNTELQEGLMSSRLVPFSRLAPRLQRIVRQTSTELHKPAELIVINAEGEMDRTLLERIVAPLEHMLRNAVDHGLESPADRATAGKEAMGRITLSIGREGGEIILTLADDGRGVNVDAVRKKAIERGLLDENTVISEKELLQFLFSAGFSTAQKVTQISGRGVGMDVVQSEIKQLGGTVVIHSVAGKGTTFVMRLPFTVAVSRALMVRIGEDVYAIPLSQIEGIVRASPYELETYYSPDAPPFEYANIGYKLHYLGEFVHGVRVPSLFGQTLPLPIMLVRGAEQRVAIQVDQLIGSREIVVKSVGAQLASVAGISGATILGDGSVVIILDTVAMLRAASLQKPRQKQQIIDGIAAKSERTTRTVMVVDDSVTVRKVTSRLLERHGFEVVLAKDGLDAITKLEDIRPDIMLLDIEMPRMDGFEVASLVRHNPNLIGLPIIMITSRTGEKHRERAFQIGVNAYMGKPFQEQQLLETISELLAAVAAR
jgi:chemosensory pili system protein ChpA (sensor histidine kinase/response regulator)